MFVYSAIGHRPLDVKSLGLPYSNEQLQKWTNYTARKLEPIIKEFPVKEAIVGVNLGFDVVFALCMNQLKVDYTIVMPFRDQESKWHAKRDVSRHYKMLENAKTIIYVDEYDKEQGIINNKFPTIRKNEFMLDFSDIVIAYWMGNTSAISYQLNQAQKREKKIFNLYEGIK